MKKILITAYAINPYKGSEDAMGWNMVMQAARFHHLIVVTRKNNRPAIEKYIGENSGLNEQFDRIRFVYFDWPAWTIRWKKGALLSMIYYYGWQLSLALWLKKRIQTFQPDIVHNLNFHNDWTPSFLWMLKKPLVWGHVGHHPKIPRQYILPVYGRTEYIKDRILWMVKNIFWKLDPFLALSRKRSSRIICMHPEAAKALRLKGRFIVHPSVAAEETGIKAQSQHGKFHLLSIGRFVPLKGFDLALRGFAAFYQALPAEDRQQVRLTLIGQGPFKEKLASIIREERMEEAVEIIDWMPREQLASYYSTASAFLFPSHEGAGMVVPEALSYQLPVVCLDNCGPGRLIHPGSKLKIPESGYRETVELISVRLMKLFKIPAFHLHEQTLAEERFQEMLRWDVRGEMLKNVYDEIVPAAQVKTRFTKTTETCQ